MIPIVTSGENVYIQIHSSTESVLMQVPVTSACQHIQQLSQSDYIKLSWISDTGSLLPAGAYVVGDDDERYVLLNPYSPTMIDEATYKYEPQFTSRFFSLAKVPFFMYTYDGGGAITLREPDWSLTDNAGNFMQALCDGIYNETGLRYGYAIGSDITVGSATVTFNATDIISAANAIANAFGTEVWLEKTASGSDIGIIHLSKARLNAETAPELIVGTNVGVPSVKDNGAFYNRFYAFGSSRNITQDYMGSGVNNLATKRLTLNPTEFPNGYMDFSGGSNIQSIVLQFDDIYPSATNLVLYDVRPRMRYRLDDNGKKIQIGTDEHGDPVYDSYAIWYAQLKQKDGSTYTDFDFNDSTYDAEDNPDGMMIAGLVPSFHFNSGALTGREFDVIYHKTAQTVQDNADYGSFQIKAGDFEIVYTQEGNLIIPTTVGLIPDDDNLVVLFNVRMPDTYVTSAQARLKEALLKEIREKYLQLDSEGNAILVNGELQPVDRKEYTVKSYSDIFNSTGISLTVGAAVTFTVGTTSFETRVTSLTKQIDFPDEQSITVGNEVIKGALETLQESAQSANQNINILAAVNQASKSIIDSYNRTQQVLIEGLAAIGNMWLVQPDNSIKLNPDFIGVWTEGFVSAFGQSDTGGGGGGGIDLSAMWTNLQINESGVTGYGLQIDYHHLPTIAYNGDSGFVTSAAWSKTGSTNYLTLTRRALTASDIPSLTTSKISDLETWINGKDFLTGNETITLSGVVSGSGTTAITTSIADGKITNAMLAGSIANGKLANSAITINGSSTALGGSFATASITAGTAGTSSATSGLSITIPYVTLNKYGIVTAYGTHTHSISKANITSAIGSTTYAPYNSAGYLPLNGGVMTGPISGVTYLSVNRAAQTTYRLDVNGATRLGGALTVSGATTFNNNVTVDSTSSITLGNGVLTWDAQNSAWKLTGNLYATGFISAFGASDTGGGGGGIDLSAMWANLQVNESGTTGYNLQINPGHLTTALGTYVNGITTTGSGNAITAVSKDGSTLTFTKGSSYLPLSGGTLTGHLYLSSAQIYIKNSDTAILTGTTSTSSAAGTSMIGQARGTTTIRGFNDPIWRRYTNGGSYTDYTIWHAGNDGSGSGLDADLLDGQHGSYYATASSLGNYLPLAGGTMTGDIVLGNAINIQANDSGGTARTIMGLNSSNALHIGYSTGGQGYITRIYGGDIEFHYGTARALGMTLNSDGQLVKANDTPYAAYDTGGTVRTLMSLNASNQVWIAYGTAGAGYNTNLCGNQIDFRYGTGRTTGMTLTSDGDVTLTNTLCLNNNKTIRWKDTSGNLLQCLQFNSVNRFHVGYGAAVAGYDTYINGNNIYFRYGTTPTNGAIITSDGNVGIGTTTPAVKLHVNGGARVYSASSTNVWTSYSGAQMSFNKLSTYTTGYNQGILFRSVDSSGTLVASKYLLGVYSGSAYSYMYLGGSYTDATVRITDTGVGIMKGNASPSYALDVAGTVAASGLLSANGGITVPSGQSITLGNGVLTWDSTNSAWKLTGNLYATGFISAFGASDTGGSGGGGINLAAMWANLQVNDSDTTGYGLQIHPGHLTTALGTYVNAVTTAGSGNVVTGITKSGQTLTVTYGSGSGGGGLSIIDLDDNGTTTAGTWLASSSAISAYTDGLMVRYKLTKAGAATTTLNINGLGAKTVYRFNSTKLTTHYSVGSYVILIYNTSLNSGCWITVDGYDSNTNTYVRQYVASDNAEYSLLARYATASVSSYQDNFARFANAVTLNPSKGSISATQFYQNGNRVPNITVSSSAPSASDGEVGDVWIQV